MIKFLVSLISLISAGDGNSVVNPIYEGMTLVGPYAMGVVALLTLFYGVFLGVKYAKAEDEAEKANVQKTLKNFLIGAFSVIVLLAILYVIRGPIAGFINNGV
ncbi:MAG: hypothetical protein IJ538_00015 [Clostridia bacterium]|nr:hypothetical protein [Clostridia bacterium]